MSVRVLKRERDSWNFMAVDIKDQLVAAHSKGTGGEEWRWEDERCIIHDE